MRVHHSLRRASTAILLLSCTTILLGVIDIEIYHGVKGNMNMPSRPAIFGESCSYNWVDYTNNSRTMDESQIAQIQHLGGFLDNFVKGEPSRTYTDKNDSVTITLLTIGLAFLIWWYAELERRLLVIRHHLMEEIGLIQSPLSRYYLFELVISIIHLPPYTGLRTELQLLMFFRLMHLIKFMREHHAMRYNR